MSIEEDVPPDALHIKISSSCLKNCTSTQDVNCEALTESKTGSCPGCGDAAVTKEASDGGDHEIWTAICKDNVYGQMVIKFDKLYGAYFGR